VGMELWKTMQLRSRCKVSSDTLCFLKWIECSFSAGSLSSFSVRGS
jgi:hypothetical protein